MAAFPMPIWKCVRNGTGFAVWEDPGQIKIDLGKCAKSKHPYYSEKWKNGTKLFSEFYENAAKAEDGEDEAGKLRGKSAEIDRDKAESVNL